MTAMQERCRQCIRPQEQPALPIHVSGSASSGSSQLVGGVPPSSRGSGWSAVEPETPRVNVARLRRQQTKARPTPGGGGGGDHHLPLQNALEEQILMII